MATNLQARKVAEQSLTETAERGMSRRGESELQCTLSGMQQQPRSERPQPKQHASLIFLWADVLATVTGSDERRGEAG